MTTTTPDRARRAHTVPTPTGHDLVRSVPSPVDRARRPCLYGTAGTTGTTPASNTNHATKRRPPCPPAVPTLKVVTALAAMGDIMTRPEVGVALPREAHRRVEPRPVESLYALTLSSSHRGVSDALGTAGPV